MDAVEVFTRRLRVGHEAAADDDTDAGTVLLLLLIFFGVIAVGYFCYKKGLLIGDLTGNRAAAKALRSKPTAMTETRAAPKPPRRAPNSPGAPPTKRWQEVDSDNGEIYYWCADTDEVRDSATTMAVAQY